MNIIEFPKTISEVLCDDIIELFEEEKKQSLDIPKNDVIWGKIEYCLYKELLKNINNYKKELSTDNESIEIIQTLEKEIYMKKFNIQKYDIDIHKISNYNRTNSRKNILIIIYYLNDISEGGEIIADEKIIKPEKGKLVILPDKKYNYNPPKTQTQYIITGELYTK